jgi:hypothetical protein
MDTWRLLLVVKGSRCHDAQRSRSSGPAPGLAIPTAGQLAQATGVHLLLSGRLFGPTRAIPSGRHEEPSGRSTCEAWSPPPEGVTMTMRVGPYIGLCIAALALGDRCR